MKILVQLAIISSLASISIGIGQVRANARVPLDQISDGYHRFCDAPYVESDPVTVITCCRFKKQGASIIGEIHNRNYRLNGTCIDGRVNNNTVTGSVYLNMHTIDFNHTAADALNHAQAIARRYSDNRLRNLSPSPFASEGTPPDNILVTRPTIRRVRGEYGAPGQYIQLVKLQFRSAILNTKTFTYRAPIYSDEYPLQDCLQSV